MSKVFTTIIVIAIIVVLGIIGWYFSTSYVDMGGLLPPKVELSNSFRGDPTSSLVQGTTANIVFTYSGVRAIDIVTNKGEIVTTTGNCNLKGIYEVEFGTFNSETGKKDVTFTNTPKTNLTNGDKAVASFSCTENIIKNMDRQLEGEVTIYYNSNNIEMSSNGPIRLNIE